jgi:p-aminobenzoyl-glutamate transporter AbgT
MANWGLVGAAIGVVLGYVNYAVIMRILEPRLRATDKSRSTEERDTFERKLALMRRIILGFEVLVLGGAGYFIGSYLGELFAGQ